ncbi:GNAT family N-acetyltransferase [Demequina sp.]|uniref:GNAT family N-acetyltransferase n=1 Tax=Demequina sp. TaxID=2050685 RepID=UPI0025C25CF9|nr:GNAT family N-acetyltransferase [Demequina sp.]
MPPTIALARPVPHRIETERLVIRAYQHADAEQLATVIPRNGSHLRRYMEWMKFEPQTVAQRREWIAGVSDAYADGTSYTMGIFTPDGALIGGTGFHVRTDPERLALGYWIDATHEGHGLVTEACAALTWVALGSVGADVADISHAPSNTRSAAIPARLGYLRKDRIGIECFDDGAKVRAVEWWATRDTLATEPLASFARPALYDGEGTPVPWSL